MAIDLDELCEVNRLRAAGPSRRLQLLEERFSSVYAANHRLAVYGSLAPGRENHGELSSLDGRWLDGLHVTGELVRRGWGSDLGFSALRWSPSGTRVEVWVFESDELPRHWERLDRFEGPDYLRILVPLLSTEGAVGVANLYASSK